VGRVVEPRKAENGSPRVRRNRRHRGTSGDGQPVSMVFHVRGYSHYSCDDCCKYRYHIAINLLRVRICW